jgi:solute carrier family 45 protein 1/2/4
MSRTRFFFTFFSSFSNNPDFNTKYYFNFFFLSNQVCLTNLFCWMAHVCYSLYFTDFVGEAVFGGNPQAPTNSDERELYEKGVRFGCWGMSTYSLSCSCYSLIIERLIQRFRARKVRTFDIMTIVNNID